MAVKNEEYRKNKAFPEEGTPAFMEVMGRSLQAYDAALDLLIEVMEQIRNSFREMIEIQYGISEYEEFLKDNRSAEKAKELRPGVVERTALSEEEQDDQRLQREVQEDQDQRKNQEEQEMRSVLQRTENQSGMDPEEQNETQDMLQDARSVAKQDPEDLREEQMADIYDPDLVQELESLSQPEEKRRGR